jgi:hypothetical protein
MSAFVVPPKPKSEKIPVITAEELGHALKAYITATYPTFSYTGQDIEGTKDDGMTSLHFYGVGMKIRVLIGDKVARSWQSKLFNMPFRVSITENHERLTFEEQTAIYGERTRHLLIEPRADRSISINRILRWDNGQPVLEA